MNPYGRKPAPLYTEHRHHGTIVIKIAQPDVWIQKAKWVYMETHPWEDFSESSNYMFLDGDGNNFSSENIVRVSRRVAGMISLLGGLKKGCPEENKLLIASAKLKLAVMDAGEKAGLVANWGTDEHPRRRFRDEYNRYYRNKRAKPEERKKHAESTRKCYWKKKKSLEGR